MADDRGERPSEGSGYGQEKYRFRRRQKLIAVKQEKRMSKEKRCGGKTKQMEKMPNENKSGCM